MTELLEKDLVYQIVGCAMAVHNEIGHGLREKTYERALCVEFDVTGLAYSQQEVFAVYYRNVKVDDYVPDLVVEKAVLVDAKTVEQ